MAFAAGKESTEAGVVKRYIGVAPVKILAVNPSKEELEKLYGTELENAPEYVGEVEVGEDKHKVNNARLDFIIKTDADRCGGIDVLTKAVFFVRNEPRYNRDRTKVQVIDKYGRTAWVTIEQAKAHEIPMYSNGPANLDKDYRPAYVGEEELTNFLITYLNIPSVMRYNRDNGTWKIVDNPSDSEARLEAISSYFKGDFSELRGAIALQPNNKVKCMFGVRTTEDNKQYQTVYTQMFLRNNSTDYNRLEKDLNERKAAGAYPTTEFSTCNLKEYVVEPTTFAEKVVDDLPFGTPETASPWD